MSLSQRETSAPQAGWGDHCKLDDRGVRFLEFYRNFLNFIEFFGFDRMCLIFFLIL